MYVYIYFRSSVSLHFVTHTIALLASGQEPEGMNRPLPLTSWSPGRL